MYVIILPQMCVSVLLGMEEPLEDLKDTHQLAIVVSEGGRVKELRIENRMLLD